MNTLSVIITDNIDYFNKAETTQKSVFTNKSSLVELLNRLLNKEYSDEYIIYSFDFETLWKNFTANFKVIDAAGGLVHNDKNELLFIFRKGKWDLPKGKVEKNELIFDAAKREVEEECGLTDLRVNNKLTTTYHTYKDGGKWVLKASYWYDMHSNQTKLTPQLEEGITDVCWKAKDSCKKEVMHNTYKSVAHLLKEFF